VSGSSDRREEVEVFQIKIWPPKGGNIAVSTNLLLTVFRILKEYSGTLIEYSSSLLDRRNVVDEHAN